VRAGATLAAACRLTGISPRTVRRWRTSVTKADGRCGPREVPANALSDAERENVLRVVNSPEYRDLSPKQIVPRLADEGRYLASESTMYRILREAGQLAHRSRARAPVSRPVERHVARRPDEVWSWDITYLKTPVRGVFLYLYLIMDVFSRKIVGWSVHADESAEHAASLMRTTCGSLGLDPGGIVLHSDNGGPMKGSTMLATLQWLGVVPSFSRPSVKNDNAFSEALFRTLKYRPEYPSKPFASIADASAWVDNFVHWFNTEHRHSAIRFVTPEERHEGFEAEILNQRRRLYERARRKHPHRWSGAIRNWSPIQEVYLNPEERRAA
jgi:transposase InsO family protein